MPVIDLANKQSPAAVWSEVLTVMLYPHPDDELTRISEGPAIARRAVENQWAVYKKPWPPPGICLPNVEFSDQQVSVMLFYEYVRYLPWPDGLLLRSEDGLFTGVVFRTMLRCSQHHPDLADLSLVLGAAKERASACDDWSAERVEKAWSTCVSAAHLWATTQAFVEKGVDFGVMWLNNKEGRETLRLFLGLSEGLRKLAEESTPDYDVEAAWRIGIPPEHRPWVLPPLGDQELGELRRYARDGGTRDSENMFRKEGDNWRIVYQGCELGLVKHRLGFEYIKIFLDNPRKLFDVVELLNAAKGENVVPGERVQEDITDETLQNYRQRCQVLRDEIEDARVLGNIEEQRKKEDELEQLTKEMSRTTDKRGRPRKVSPDVERTRKSVSQAISRAREELDPLNDDLAKHLKNCLHLGNSCQYAPPQDMTWLTS